MCEGCVDICPWKCIHMVTPDAIAEATGTEQPGEDPSDNVLFIIDDDVCTRCALCVDRCPTGVIILGKVGAPADRRSAHPHQQPRLRLRHAARRGDDHGKDHRRTTTPDREGPRHQGDRRVRAARRGAASSGPARSSARATPTAPATAATSIMNSVLYHLHPVKVKRHAVKVSYTLCLGGLSFFLFILLTVTGIFLMFFYRPDDAQAWNDISNLQTSVAFGLLVRNMHRWGAHLMVLSVFLHMARVFYHGAYKAPREFNWVIGVILLMLTLLLSLHRLPAAVGPAGAVGRHGGHQHDGLHPGVRHAGQIRAAGRRRDRRRDAAAMVRAPRADVARSSSSSSWPSTSGGSAKTAASRVRCDTRR